MHYSAAVRTSFVLAVLLALPAAAFAQAVKKAPDTREQVVFSYAPVVKMAAPAVVNVYVRQRVRRDSAFNNPIFEEFFGHGFGRSERAQNSLGSGVIVTPNGVVVTNNHVVQGDAGTEIKIALADAREFDAKVLLKDERTDLAVLQIKGSEIEFPYVNLADADQLEVGDMVLAIGNPFGVGQTVTSGIVSALARTRVGISDYQFFIQTDAAINPGNSGGALVDMQGRLVGINTAIFSKSGGSQGIGFAIPSNMVRLVVESALQGGSGVRRPWLGANITELTPQIADAVGLDRTTGVLVASVTDGGPAANAGIRPGDIVLAVDGKSVSDANAFQYRFTTKGTSGEVSLDVLRTGTRRKVSIPLMVAPETTPRDLRDINGNNPFGGAKVANLSPAVAEELSINETSGVVVVETEAYSVARRLGIKAGDVVAEINGEKIETTRGLEKIVGKGARVWRLNIRRGGQTIRTVIAG
ncbi:serine protease [Rhodomicrobium udaipurense JA643]|uniref:Do family serine endopeptidase n=1 Tax=Rhodomicrobium udaipurense TaxID=1202716 RepID=A0A8I1G9J6_9HYPH|nr:Do family serine endopeptidase [Rhodomicrobium udaipurense]KAI93397.1 serine protease [Rhodomicrobium udaipurense JA643]MBJ7543048.1 Do family serine endopeptidase [Rhodomicrobium udaipurense]